MDALGAGVSMSADRFSLQGRIVAVFGAGAGIGEAVAKTCAQQGARVVCFDINEASVGRVVQDITQAGGHASARVVDICDSAETQAGLEAVVRNLGGLDGVVCTPGINVRKPILKYQDEELDRVVRVNIKGNFNVLRAAGQVLVPRGKGSVVLFSSIRSQVVEPGQAVYAATKAAIVQMVRGAACEWGPKGVRVNAVGPGVVETPLTAPIKNNEEWYRAYAAKSILGRWCSAEEQAWPTVFLLSEAASYVTGSFLVVDGGWLANDGRFVPPGMADPV